MLKAMTTTRTRGLEITAALASVALSVWLLCMDNVLNDDGVLYIKSAEAFAEGRWQEAAEIYPWPLYSILIAVVQKATGAGFDIAAYILNTAFYALLAWAYVACIEALGGSRRDLLIALAFFLALPSVNNYRGFVIRDIGFWPFYMLALLAIFKFQRNPGWGAAAGWGASMIVATLFRLEGLVFLVGMPLVAFFDRPSPWCQRIVRFLQLNLGLAVAAAITLVWLRIEGMQAFPGRLNEPLMWIELLRSQISAGLGEKAASLGQIVLPKYSTGFALPAVFTILLLILLTHTVKSVGALGIAGLAFGARPSAYPHRQTQAFWLAVVLNFGILLAFVVVQFFLTGRYVMTLGLTLALMVPFGLSRAYDRWKQWRGNRPARNWPFVAAVALFLFMVVDSLFSFGVSKAYLKEAGQWLRTQTPADARIYSESTIVGYYAAKRGDEWKRTQPPVEEVVASDAALQNYDYVVILLGRDGKEPENLSGIVPLREFRNERNDRVRIFKAADILNAHTAKAAGRQSDLAR